MRSRCVERLGLPDYFIEQPAAQIDATAIDFENMLSELEKIKAEIEKEQSELYRRKQEIRKLKKQPERKADDIKEKRDKMLRDARRGGSKYSRRSQGSCR